MPKVHFATPEDAETAFYEAFERGDLRAMMAVWADQEEVVCVHPQGPRLIGLESIRESFAQIFSSGMSLRVEIAQGHQFQSQSLAVHCVLEVLHVVGEKQTPPPIAATNVFAYTEDGWRLIAHHASANPDSTPAENRDTHTLH